MQKLKEINEEVQRFERNRRKPSEQLKEGMIGSKQLYNINVVVSIIVCILFIILWIKYSFSIALIVSVLVYGGERIFFFRSLMKNRRIRETVTTRISDESKLKKQTMNNTSQSKRVKEKKNEAKKIAAIPAMEFDLGTETVHKEKEENTQESTQKTFSKKTFDPSKVIIKE